MAKDREAWHAAVHGVTKSWIQLSNWTINNKGPTGWRDLPVHPFTCWIVGLAPVWGKSAVTVCPPVSIRTYIFFFLWPILRKWAHWVICYMCVKFYEKQSNCFPKWLDLPAFSSVGSVQSLSHVQLFATPWTAAARLPCLSPTPGAFFKLMSIESVVPSNHLILCRPLLLLPSIFLSIRVFSYESVLHIRWPAYWEFQLQHQSFQWLFRTDFL